MKPGRETNNHTTPKIPRLPRMVALVAAGLLTAGLLIPQGCSQEERIQQDPRDPERTHEESMERLEERREE